MVPHAARLDGFYWACSNAAGIAVMNFAAQNYGAGRMDRVHDCEKLSLKLFMGVTLLFSAVLLGVGRFLLPLFNDDAEVLAKTWQVMLYMVPLYFTWTYIEIISGVLRGIGDAVVPVIIIGRRRVPAEGGMDSDSIQGRTPPCSTYASRIQYPG